MPFSETTLNSQAYLRSIPTPKKAVSGSPLRNFG